MQFRSILETHAELTFLHTHTHTHISFREYHNTFETVSCVCRGVSIFTGEGAYTGTEEQGDSPLGRQSCKAQPGSCLGLCNLHGCFFLDDIGRLTG